MFEFLIVILSFFIFKWLPPLTERNVLVLVKTRGIYIDKLPDVQGLKVAFRTLENLDDIIIKDVTKGEDHEKVNISQIPSFT